MAGFLSRDAGVTVSIRQCLLKPGVRNKMKLLEERVMEKVGVVRLGKWSKQACVIFLERPAEGDEEGGG